MFKLIRDILRYLIKFKKFHCAMKKIFFLICALPLLSFTPLLNDEPEKTSINWVTIEEAEQLTKENPRKIFVDVYTDWCGWCKKMDKSTFADPDVVEYVNKHFYAVKLDAESDQKINLKGMDTTGRQLAASFKVTGYPTIVFIDENFHKVTPVPGYRQAKEFKDILMQINGEK